MKRINKLISVIVIIIIALLVSTSCSRRLSLCAVGDILLDRGVRTTLVQKGYNYPYEKVKSIIEDADIAIGNLECSLTERGTPVFKNRKIIFKGDVENGQALKKAGFDILNLANNHTMDYGCEGLESTIKILNDLNIHTPGAGFNSEEARKPAFVEKKNHIIGFLCYTVFPPEGYISFVDRPDAARIDYNTIAKEVCETKKRCDFLVVSFHWGNEFEFFPRDTQKKLAHTAVDSGGDLVIGHHPHVLQGVEKYKNRLIFYSLGNFVFDRQIQGGSDETVILDLRIENKRWKEARIIPVKIVNCQPRIAGGGDAEYILNRLKLYSKGMNTDIIMENGIGYIKNI